MMDSFVQEVQIRPKVAGPVQLGIIVLPSKIPSYAPKVIFALELVIPSQKSVTLALLP
jgi:hypothetical protein